MINDDHKREIFDGFFIADCAVRERFALSFALKSLASEKGTLIRLVNYFLDDSSFGWHEYSGIHFPMVVCTHQPAEQAVMVDMKGTTVVLGGGDDQMEAKIDSSGLNPPIISTVLGLNTIGGVAYATGAWRAVCRRTGPNQWESIVDRNTMPIPTKKDGFESGGGFSAIAGFNAHDIYCVGSWGDAWRFDGKRWHVCPLQTNMLLENVCCAGDGLVYIGMQSGSVMRGRGDQWEIIHKGNMTLPFKDMVWFQDRVWCTSDYGTWQIVDGKVIEANLPVDIRACSGNLSVGDGVLLLAGMYGAAVFDGQTWTRLI